MNRKNSGAGVAIASCCDGGEGGLVWDGLYSRLAWLDASQGVYKKNRQKTLEDPTPLAIFGQVIHGSSISS